MWRRAERAGLAAGALLCPFCLVESRQVWSLFLVAWSAAILGFLLLLMWSILHGQFRDTEKPKYGVLDAEGRE